MWANIGVEIRAGTNFSVGRVECAMGTPCGSPGGSPGGTRASRDNDYIGEVRFPVCIREDLRTGLGLGLGLR